MKRQYYLACTACGGESLSMSQVLEAEDEEHMKGQVLNKTFSHPGYGWELEDFIMTCSKCKGHDFEVQNAVVKDEKKEED